jgi:hypothetical protein
MANIKQFSFKSQFIHKNSEKITKDYRLNSSEDALDLRGAGDELEAVTSGARFANKVY